jgi:hypothetical protein
MAELDRSKRFSLFTLVLLENHLADLLGVQIDLSPVDSMKEDICNKAILESILAFRRTNLITPFAQKLKENQTTPNCVS